MDRRAVEEGISRAIARNTALAVRAAGSGAHGIMVGDDIAYSGGLYASPRDLAAVLFPRLREVVAAIKDLGCVPFFHSDGNLNAVFEGIVSLGFEVIHSLEPSAGMDLRSLKETYGGRVCLMGNVEIERLADSAAEHVRQSAIGAIEAAARGGGFILSTSSGVIRSAVPVGHVLALKDALMGHGAYPIRASTRADGR
jgi:uroporphyrinogen decarboxylase